MESYLFAIDEFNPQHWSYAVREGVWDTTKALRKDPVNPGDLLYFWQSGKRRKPGHIGLFLPEVGVGESAADEQHA